MTNLEKLDTLPELQKALEQERATSEARERFLEGALENAKARAERAETALAAEQESRLRTLHRAEEAENRIRVLVEVDIDALNRAVTEEAARAEHAERERDEVRVELARVRGLPDMEWAQASAVIMQGLALHARTDQPAAKRMAEALDKAKTYVDRLKARVERAEADNAALVQQVLLLGGASPRDWIPRFRALHDTASSGAHPGAALQEYVRALEAVREAVRITTVDGVVYVVAHESIAERVTIADALRMGR